MGGSLRLSEEGLDLGDDPGEDDVHEEQVEAEEDGGRDDDRRVDDLVAGRPGDLLELGPDVLEEVPEPFVPADLVVHGVLSFRRPRRGPSGPAPPSPGEGVAGEAGLEPATCGFGDRCSTN